MASPLPADASALLRMESVRKSFDGVTALDNARLHVQAGEVHGLIGQNGAGKSTLIKILTGIFRGDGGTVVFDGAPVAFASPHEAQQNGIAPIYQELNLIPLRSVAENICLGHEPRRFGMLDIAKMKTRARDALARFGVDIDVAERLDNFSAGMRQLIAIARAVSLNAKLVIMDEPTSSLDARESEFLFMVIRDLKQSGVGVLYVTHFLDELFLNCDRVTIMRDGKWVRTTQIGEVDKLKLTADMLGLNIEEVRKAAVDDDSAGGTTGDLLMSVRGLAAPPRVKDISFTVHSGEILGLGGLLGSGRTETVRAIFGADRRMRGTVDLPAATQTVSDSPRASIHGGLGYLTEDRKVDGIIPDLSVRENITLVLLPRLTRWGRVDKRRENEIVDRFIQQLDIKLVDREQPIRHLSGGNQQKVLLAKWFAADPRVLILDEPTRGVDVGARREIQSIIREFVGEQRAVIMISSEFEELAERADRIVIIHEGESAGEIRNPGITEDTLVNAIMRQQDAA